MFCANCGKEIPEGTKICPNCNQPVTVISPGSQPKGPGSVPPPVPSTARTSGLAIASLVLGILGIISYGLLGIAGIVLGIIAINKINRSQGKLKGKSYAIAGIATGAALFCMILIMTLIAMPNLLRLTKKATQVEAKRNLEEIFYKQIDFHGGNNEYGKTFQDIDWAPEKETRYSYFLAPDQVIDAKEGGPYSLHTGVEPFVDEFRFQAVAIGNIDRDPTLDVWTINQDKELKNLVNDVELNKLKVYERQAELRGGTPLIYAADAGDFVVCKYLLEKGLEINARDNIGFTVLHYAAMTGSYDIIELLIDHGADLESRDSNGLAPLHHAALKGRTGACEMLIAKGADPDSKTDNGTTPLHLAAGKGHIEVCNLLLEKGAAVDIQDNKGLIPQDWAVNYPEVLELISSQIEPLGKGIVEEMLLKIEEAGKENKIELEEINVKHREENRGVSVIPIQIKGTGAFVYLEKFFRDISMLDGTGRGGLGSYIAELKIIEREKKQLLNFSLVLYISPHKGQYAVLQALHDIIESLPGQGVLLKNIEFKEQYPFSRILLDGECSDKNFVKDFMSSLQSLDMDPNLRYIRTKKGGKGAFNYTFRMTAQLKKIRAR